MPFLFYSNKMGKLQFHNAFDFFYMKNIIFCLIALMSLLTSAAWPTATNTMKPWVYNWWMGSAVDEEGLKLQIEEMAKTGMGGMHIIPIYSVKKNPNDLVYLSPKWMDAFGMAVRLASEKGMGVDLTTGSGWCFGGPQLSNEDGCWKLEVNSQPHDDAKVLWQGKDADGKKVILSARPTGQKVKRAGPGGQGPMMNPFSASAMTAFLTPFTAAFDQPGMLRPKRMYHDSYEYFGASWCWELPAAFEKRRGYRLEDHYAALAGVGDPQIVARVKCDYRETLSELMIEDVFFQWQKWCAARGIETRNEAHGSPANWLDFYALADIPETEMFGCEKMKAQIPTISAAFMNSGDRDILISKFASSAAHVKHAGASVAPLVSAESCTWICEHFCETAGAVKTFVDRLLLAGVNHVYYQGMTYSPVDAKWPGWTFYATCHMNRFNPVWREADVLNSYITRVQSIAQTTAVDNDVLVYWPLHDYWMEAAGFERQMSVHKRSWFDDEAIGRVARALYDAGYAFDFISEKQLMVLADAKATRYTTIVVPHAKAMKPATFARLLALAARGYQIRFADALPQTVPGFKNVAAGEAELARLKKSLPMGVQVQSLAELIVTAPARKEPFNKANGLMFTRQVKDGITYYFIANQLCDAGVNGVFRPSTLCKSATIMDPLSGHIKPLAVTDGAVELSLGIGESVILVVSGKNAPPPEKPMRLYTTVACDGTWVRTPVVGGPELPVVKAGTLPLMWGVGDVFPESAFAGTMRYETKVTLPDVGSGQAKLALGKIAESARVFVNNVSVGAAILPPWKVAFDADLLKKGVNTITVEVTSSGANRLKWLDATKPYEWKVFTDINMVDIAYKQLDASSWDLRAYGLYGPVSLMMPIR